MLQIDAGGVLATLALILAAWSAYKTNQFNKRQITFEETAERLNLLLIGKEAAEAEAGTRANLSASFYKGDKNSYRLKPYRKSLLICRSHDDDGEVEETVRFLTEDLQLRVKPLRFFWVCGDQAKNRSVPSRGSA